MSFFVDRRAGLTLSVSSARQEQNLIKRMSMVSHSGNNESFQPFYKAMCIDEMSVPTFRLN
jgi:hypothetical protein